MLKYQTSYIYYILLTDLSACCYGRNLFHLFSPLEFPSPLSPMSLLEVARGMVGKEGNNDVPLGGTDNRAVAP